VIKSEPLNVALREERGLRPHQRGGKVNMKGKKNEANGFTEESNVWELPIGPSREGRSRIIIKIVREEQWDLRGAGPLSAGYRMGSKKRKERAPTFSARRGDGVGVTKSSTHGKLGGCGRQ